MNRSRIIALAVALVAALLAIFLSRGLFAPQEAAPVAEVAPSDTVDVLIAAKDLTQGELMGGYGLQWRSWPRANLSSAMITREAQPDALETLKNARARLPLVSGELIVPSRFVLPDDRGFMAAILPAGMRGVAVGISENSAVSGFILPNDRVDVILTLRKSSTTGGTTEVGSETVLSNVKVLAINQILIQADGNSAIPQGRTAVLELEPSQAEVLFKIAASGELSLVLRSLAEDAGRSAADDKPVLADSYRYGRQTGGAGTLLVRAGREQFVINW